MPKGVAQTYINLYVYTIWMLLKTEKILKRWEYQTLVAQTVQNLPAMQETQVRSLSWEDPLEKEIATHSSILVWRTPWTEEPGIVDLDMTVKLTHASKSSVSR